MKKIVKLFLTVFTIWIGFIFTIPLVGAIWPPKDCMFVNTKISESQMYDMCEEALFEELAVATYCFFNPTNEGFYCQQPKFLAHPKVGTSLNRIPVAIYLPSEDAKVAFRTYFQDKSDHSINDIIKSKVDPGENVFIISFKDLNEIAKKGSINLYTRNGVIGGLNDVHWSWKAVIYKTHLLAGWRDADTAAWQLPTIDQRRKVRVLMSELTGLKVGQTIRIKTANIATEIGLWSDRWTGRDVIEGK